MQTSFTVSAAAAAFLCAGALAQAEFDAPVRITAGGDNFSEVLYPSPVLFDVNEDGQRDLVIGDLWGRLLIAQRLSGDPSAGWGPAANINATDGQPIKFSNW